MRLHEMKSKPGATHRRKRVGRGTAAGQGKTAGRGTKGQGARQGGGPSVYFQGGNLPFFRRLPFKRGFTPLQRVEYSEINLEALQEVPSGFLVTAESLVGLGLVKDASKPVVILGRGEVKVPLKVRVQRVTASARAKLEAAGGTVEIVAPASQGML
ncbi:MAG: 50S ribosomal protein L15 [Anaerolineales bacterium]